MSFSIKIVAKQTGLSEFLIRMWENRYQAIVPERSKTNRRLYNEDEISKLKILKRLTDAGYAISDIAYLDLEKLSDLLVNIEKKTEIILAVDTQNSELLISKLIEELKEFNTAFIINNLNSLLNNLKILDFLDKILTPLLNKVGTLWENNQLRIAHEHLITGIIRSLLGERLLSINQKRKNRAVFTTLSGEHHELGALAGAIIAAENAWDTVYLGANVPNMDIVYACQQHQANLLVISIIYPTNDNEISQILKDLKKELPDRIKIIIGGNKLDNYSKEIHEIKAQKSTSFRILCDLLNNYRIV
jgi:methanogenic corrinoid protein MtbC1